MNEEKAISEQELDKVSGGAGFDSFEAAWAAYTSTHCGKCAVQGVRDPVCEYGRNLAAASWAQGQSVKCRAYIDPC